MNFGNDLTSPESVFDIALVPNQIWFEKTASKIWEPTRVRRLDEFLMSCQASCSAANPLWADSVSFNWGAVGQGGTMIWICCAAVSTSFQKYEGCAVCAGKLLRVIDCITIDFILSTLYILVWKSWYRSRPVSNCEHHTNNLKARVRGINSIEVQRDKINKQNTSHQNKTNHNNYVGCY